EIVGQTDHPSFDDGAFANVGTAGRTVEGQGEITLSALAVEIEVRVFVLPFNGSDTRDFGFLELHGYWLAPWLSTPVRPGIITVDLAQRAYGGDSRGDFVIICTLGCQCDGRLPRVLSFRPTTGTLKPRLNPYPQRGRS